MACERLADLAARLPVIVGTRYKQGCLVERSQEQVGERAKGLKEWNPTAQIPVAMVTSSSSGLDPHITPAAAEFQTARIARERDMSENDVRSLVQEHTEGRQLGFLGEPRVNTLELNLALDRAHPNRNHR